MCSHLVLTGGGHEVQEGHALVTAGLGVGYPRQTVQFEPDSIPPLAPVHVVTERQDQLQHSSQPLTALNFFAGLQDCQYFWLDLIIPNVELFLVMQRSQSLFIVCYPGKTESRQSIRA